jgi:hypothetical protein
MDPIDPERIKQMTKDLCDVIGNYKDLPLPVIYGELMTILLMVHKVYGHEE